MPSAALTDGRAFSFFTQGNDPLKKVDFEFTMRQLKACLEREGVQPGCAAAAEEQRPETDAAARALARQLSLASLPGPSPSGGSPLTGRAVQLVRRVLDKLRQAGKLREDTCLLAQLVRRVGLAVHTVDAELPLSALRSPAMEEALLVSQSDAA
jgi:hypothetical protein